MTRPAAVVLVSELAADGIPVAVSCRVLKLARAPYYRWVREPVGPTEELRQQRVAALRAAQRKTARHRCLAVRVSGDRADQAMASW